MLINATCLAFSCIGMLCIHDSFRWLFIWPSSSVDIGRLTISFLFHHSFGAYPIFTYPCRNKRVTFIMQLCVFISGAFSVCGISYRFLPIYLSLPFTRDIARVLLPISRAQLIPLFVFLQLFLLNQSSRINHLAQLLPDSDI